MTDPKDATPEPPYTVVRSSAELSVDDERIVWPVTFARFDDGRAFDGPECYRSKGWFTNPEGAIWRRFWDASCYDIRLRAPVAPSEEGAGTCGGCGRASQEFDIVFTRAQWLTISPGDGYLCSVCIIERCKQLPGAINLTCRLTFSEDFDGEPGGKYFVFLKATEKAQSAPSPVSPVEVSAESVDSWCCPDCHTGTLRDCWCTPTPSPGDAVAVSALAADIYEDHGQGVGRIGAAVIAERLLAKYDVRLK